MMCMRSFWVEHKRAFRHFSKVSAMVFKAKKRGEGPALFGFKYLKETVSSGATADYGPRQHRS